MAGRAAKLDEDALVAPAMLSPVLPGKAAKPPAQQTKRRLESTVYIRDYNGADSGSDTSGSRQRWHPRVA